MRTLLRITIPVKAGNAAINDGRLPQIMESLMEQLKPEAAYFQTHLGMRNAFIVFDLKEPSQIPQIAEPLFQGFNAAVEFAPVMNADDLRAGLEAATKRPLKRR
jgi:hypothetical protein